MDAGGLVWWFYNHHGRTLAALLLLVCVLCLHDSNKESLQRFPPAHLSHSKRALIIEGNLARQKQKGRPNYWDAARHTRFFPQPGAFVPTNCVPKSRRLGWKARLVPQGNVFSFYSFQPHASEKRRKRLFFTPVFEWNTFFVWDIMWILRDKPDDRVSLGIRSQSVADLIFLTSSPTNYHFFIAFSSHSHEEEAIN